MTIGRILGLLPLLLLGLALPAEATLKVAIPSTLYHGVEQTVRVELTEDSRDQRVQLILRQPGGEEQLIHEADLARGERRLLRFRLPADLGRGSFQLTVGAQRDKLSFGVRVEDPLRVRVATDKPIYRPGEPLRVRLLALESISGGAAVDRRLMVKVEDSRGNVIANRELTTNEMGVAATEVGLNEEALGGRYSITVTRDPQRWRQQVQVGEYTLPPFRLEGELEQPYYLPDQMVEATFEAYYAYGEKVGNGQFRAVLRLAGLPEAILRTSGTTDEEGRFEVTRRLSRQFLEQALERLGEDSATLVCEVEVEDQAGKTMRLTTSAPVALEPLLFEARAGSGRLVAGVEDDIYLRVMTPDGRPVAAAVQLEAAGQIHETESDALGIARFPVQVPRSEDRLDLEVRAEDAQGHSGEAELDLPIERGANDNALLLRPAWLVTSPGKRIVLEVQSQQALPNPLPITVRKAGAIVWSGEITEAGRRLTTDIPVPEGITGQLAVTVGEGSRRDTRSIYLVPDGSLEVEIEKDKEEYRPGETARLRIRVTRDGEPVTAAVGLAIVDERVFQLRARDPFHYRVFFTLLEALRGDPLARKALEPDEPLEQALGFLFAGQRLDFEPFDQELDTRTWARRESRQRLRRLAGLVRQYRHHYTFRGRMANPLDWLARYVLTRPEDLEILYDAWGNAFAVTWSERDRQYLVQSAGYDRRLGSRDDLKVYLGRYFAGRN